jgi:CRP/FNR family cyclic AMP-dependent transcriptional regulator
MQGEGQMLVDQGQTRNFKDGQIIFNEGDPGTEIFVIRNGKVRIVGTAQGRETTLGVLNKSDFFGEMSLLTGRPRSATAKAVGDVELVVIEKAQFERLVDDPLVRMMLERMSERIWRVDRELKELSAQDQIRREHLAGLVQHRSWVV